MAKTYEWIGRYTTVAGEYSFTMSNIPQNYTDLLIQLDSNQTGDNIIEIIFNGASNNACYITRWETPNTAGTLSENFGGYNRIARNGGSLRVELFNYSSNGNYKPGLYHNTENRSDSNAAGIQFGCLQTNVTAPITSVGFKNYTTNAFTTGSTMDIWGIRSA